MKQILIRKPSVDVTLKRVDDIGYIFINPKTTIGTETIKGIPKWFRMNENEVIAFYAPNTETNERNLGAIVYRPVFDENTGEFIHGEIRLNATGWDPQYSSSLVVNMNDHVDGEGEQPR